MAVKSSILRALDMAGLQVFQPVVRLLTGEDPAQQLRSIILFILVPVMAFGVFLAIWGGVAHTVVTKYGTLPSPSQVWEQAGALLDAHRQARADERDFYARHQARAAPYVSYAARLEHQAALAASPADKSELLAKAKQSKARAADFLSKRYTGGPTYLDQIMTSLKTVFAGFVVASMIAIPLGILCGLSPVFLAAMNPLIQIFKPVSPLAWLPIVMIVVGARLHHRTEPGMVREVVPQLGVDRRAVFAVAHADQHGPRRGERSTKTTSTSRACCALSWWTRIRKIVIPSALPYIFAGLRISLGVGWMVLIAAEMLAQNPGLGKFVWDMFQNGSSADAGADHGRSLHDRADRIPARPHHDHFAARVQL